VEECRNVFFNVKKTISFFLSTNLAEVLAVLFATLVLWKFEFLTSTQLLWINLITDSLPVLALGVERTENAMLRPPVSEKEIFSKKSLFEMAFYGIVQTAIVVGLFAFALGAWGNGAASTAAFVTLSLLELFHAFNVRSEDRSLFDQGMLSNPAMNRAFLAGLAMQLSVLLVPPLQGVFSVTTMNAPQWCTVLALETAPIPICEAAKAMALPRNAPEEAVTAKQR